MTKCHIRSTMELQSKVLTGLLIEALNMIGSFNYAGYYAGLQTCILRTGRKYTYQYLYS